MPTPRGKGKQTTRQRKELVERGIDPDTGEALDSAEQQDSEAAQPERRDPGKRPAGYGDELLWAMAEEFERLAYKHRVGLGGRGVPYIYKALAETADRSGIRDMECRDGNAKVVRGAELGVRLVRFFWDRAPWDGAGDVISQFADPIMFEECLVAMRKAWQRRRAHTLIQKKMGQPVPPLPPRRRMMEGN